MEIFYKRSGSHLLTAYNHNELLWLCLEIVDFLISKGGGIGMELYSKVFRHKVKKELTLRSYNPDSESYFDLIKMARSDGYNQVIINSEIMISIIHSLLETDNILMKITMSDNTDQDVRESIDYVVKKMKHDKLLFFKLKSELEWVIDSGSIDINCIDIYFEKQRYTIYSNGLVIGKQIHTVFKKLIKPVLGVYFNVK